jgi:hypothetical protein
MMSTAVASASPLPAALLWRLTMLADLIKRVEESRDDR